MWKAERAGPKRNVGVREDARRSGEVRLGSSEKGERLLPSPFPSLPGNGSIFPFLFCSRYVPGSGKGCRARCGALLDGAPSPARREVAPPL